MDIESNKQICNDDIKIVRNLHEVYSYGVWTIGGAYFKPTGIVTVKWYWKDDEGNAHSHTLEHALYFPESPVNIISSTDSAYQYDDDDGTYIKTKCHSSEFS